MNPRAVVLAAATVVAVLGGAPASAAEQPARCPSARAVMVVVDFAELGGGVTQSCRPSGGSAALELFEDSGHPITYVQRQPGFVCRVSGKPVEDPCVVTPPDDAYWGLWWSDAGSTEWSYATVGADSLTIPDGGAVAFAWHDGGDRTPPGVPVAGQRGAGQGTTVGTTTAPEAEAGLPTWVAPAAVGALFASAIAVAAFRRRRAG
ncbi:MAG: hypothetical protein ACRDOM_09805 [Nocardioides sp.]